jgi:hypothetical protein
VTGWRVLFQEVPSVGWRWWLGVASDVLTAVMLLVGTVWFFFAVLTVLVTGAGLVWRLLGSQ